MFSNKTQKLLSLQNDYIERINKNAVKLDKQLTFLMDVQNHISKQMGGALGNKPSEFPTLDENTQAQATARAQRSDNEDAKKASKEEATSKRQALMDKLQANTDQKSVQILQELRNIGNITKKGQVRIVNKLIEESKSIVAAPLSPVQVETDTEPTIRDQRDGQSVSGATGPVNTGPDGGVQPGPGTDGARQQSRPSTDDSAAALSEQESQAQQIAAQEARLAKQEQKAAELTDNHEQLQKDAEEARRRAQGTQNPQAQEVAKEAERLAKDSLIAKDAADASVGRNKERLQKLQGFTRVVGKSTQAIDRSLTDVKDAKAAEEAAALAKSIHVEQQATPFQVAAVYNELLTGMMDFQQVQSEQLQQSLEGLDKSMKEMKTQSEDRAKKMAQLIKQTEAISSSSSTVPLTGKAQQNVENMTGQLKEGKITLEDAAAVLQLSKEPSSQGTSTNI